MRGWPRCASIRSPPKQALSAGSGSDPRYGMRRAEGCELRAGLAVGARTAKKSLVARAAARSAGTADMLAAYIRSPAAASRQLEPAVKRGKKLAAFGAGHSRPGTHQPRRGRARVRAPVVQDVPDGAEESRDGHQGAVRGPHPDDAHPRAGLR